MKKTLLILLFTICFASVYSQNYAEQDKEGLRAILRQTGASFNTGAPIYNTPVYSLFGISESDTLTWTVSEGWIEKVVTVLWNDEKPKQVRAMRWGRGQGVRDLSFDLSYFVNIDTLSVNLLKISPSMYPQSTEIMLSEKNTSLRYLSASTATLSVPTSLPLLDYVHLYNYRGGFSDWRNLSGLKFLSIYNDGTTLGRMDLSENLLLEDVNITGILTSINLPSTQTLKYLKLSTASFENNYISSFDFSKAPNLELLHISGPYSQIDKLDFSSNLNLNELSISTVYPYNQPRELIFGDINPEYLSIYSTPIVGDVFDFSKMTNLKKLLCKSTAATEIIFPETSSLDDVDIQGNRLLLSKLPLGSYSNYVYADQIYISDDVFISKGIDLSSEYEIDGYITDFKWKHNGTVVTLSGQNGVFKDINEYVDKKLVCEMTNARFPGLTVTYYVNVINDIAGLNPDLDGQLSIESSIINSENSIIVLNADVAVANLYNISGQHISTTTLSGDRSEVQILNKGIYILKIITDNGIVKTFKVLAK